MAAVVTPLEAAPDEAFSGGMLGDGLVLDPLEGILRAPCDGSILSVAPTGHSVTLELPGGAQILIHIGIDTVLMAGSGFVPQVTTGDKVALGDELIRFDLDAVARQAKSAMTPFVLMSPEHSVRIVCGHRQVESGEFLMELTPLQSMENSADQDEGVAVKRSVKVALPHGLHARPSAKIVACLSKRGAQVQFHCAGRVANARSITSILALGVVCGDELLVEARGSDATVAINSVIDLIENGLREAEASHATPTAAATPLFDVSVAPGEIRGIRAAPGGAIGRAYSLVSGDRPVPETGSAQHEEEHALNVARERLRKTLEGLSAQSDIAEAHIGILDDPELISGACDHLARGASAAHAWRSATRNQIAAIRATGNALLIERIADFIDLERQLIEVLLGPVRGESQPMPFGSILIAQELLPSEFLQLDMQRVAGIVTADGGPTSHVAILAASRGVPMLVSAGKEVLATEDGALLIIDAVRPVLLVDPPAAVRDEHELRFAQALADEQAALQAARKICHTADGVRIEVFANCGSLQDAELARSLGAEGCGLLRSEFLFLSRNLPPDEDEQARAYGDIAQALADLPVIVRTLDAGSDKPLAYLPMPPEENPALGLRGVRVSLGRPELLRQQYRAILKGMPIQQRRIMLPMVNDLAEYRRARAILREEEAKLGLDEPTRLGIMVETPAAALMADRLAREVDFLSVGTNDLVQYTLAADRGHKGLASIQDAMHPAVLLLIAKAAQGAHAHGRWIGVCGGLASDPDAAPLLIGLGVDELSATPRQVPAVKARIGQVVHAECLSLAQAALEQDDADSVRRLASALNEGH